MKTSHVPAPVLVTEQNGIVDIRINRPEAKNSLNQATISALIVALNDVQSASSARCVLLGSSGTEAFCAGADIQELVACTTAVGRREFFTSVAALIESVHRCPVPVVGRVHGFALAGGCGLAAACDIVLASEDAVFGLPEVGIGLAPMVVMAPIHRVIGRRALSELVLTGQRISARRALAIGLVTRVYPKGDLDGEALKMCDKLKRQSPEALKRSKAMMLEVSEAEYFPLLNRLADESALLSIGPEAQEGLQAFIEKREPSWRPPSNNVG